MGYIDEHETIPELLRRRAARHGSDVFCRFEDRAITVAELERAVAGLANGLTRIGIRRGQRVATILPNHPDHIVTLLALFELGAVWVPVNVNLRGPSLRLLLDQSEPDALIVDARYREALEPALGERRLDRVVWRGACAGSRAQGVFRFEELSDLPGSVCSAPPVATTATACIIFTSGTTGVPKGVLLTDKMLRASALGAILAGTIEDGDRLLVWEPLYHIGGIEVVTAGLLRRIELALVERFSATAFWEQARNYQATHMHHLGGILQILLRQPPSPRDREHPVRVSWGGGCTAQTWAAFESRFGVQIHEVYGMTEASSISTINVGGPPGSIGKPAPYFDLQLVDQAGEPVAGGALGEIAISGREPGLITEGYFRNPEATANALRGGRLYTGDLARSDADGYLYYAGRKTDSVRYRGENISAWEVERVVSEHPAVEECALVGVAAEIGEQDLKLFVKRVLDVRLEPEELINWCGSRLPEFQTPRYLAFVDQFEKTPSLRIRKEILSRSVTDCWDRYGEPVSEQQ